MENTNTQAEIEKTNPETTNEEGATTVVAEKTEEQATAAAAAAATVEETQKVEKPDEGVDKKEEENHTDKAKKEVQPDAKKEKPSDSEEVIKEEDKDINKEEEEKTEEPKKDDKTESKSMASEEPKEEEPTEKEVENEEVKAESTATTASENTKVTEPQNNESETKATKEEEEKVDTVKRTREPYNSSLNQLMMPWDMDNWEETVKEYEKTKSEVPTTTSQFDVLTKTRFFSVAHETFPDDVDAFMAVFPELRDMMLSVEDIFESKRVPLLRTNTTGKTELTRKQAACLVALSFFGKYSICMENSFPRFIVRAVITRPEYPHMLGIGMCYMNYLTNIGNWLKDGSCTDLLNEKITYMRHTMSQTNFENDKTELCNVEIIKTGSLSNSKAKYHADFANMYIGGGALEGGCVQEELMFAFQPELSCSMAFMEVMSPFDAIRMDNTLCYSIGKGYGHRFEFDRNALPTPDCAKKHEEPPRIIAMDAIIQGYDDQFGSKIMHRDIHKAYVCFKLASAFPELDGERKVESSIATGNWGCGAFGGDHELKFMQQWIAASVAGVSRLEYYAYDSPQMSQVIEQYETLKKKYKNVKDLYSKLKKCHDAGTVVNTLLDKKLSLSLSDHLSKFFS